ncbi:MAG: hypothetical protein MHM6MM_007829, partial [Cercozoa sp. M6MM]
FKKKHEAEKRAKLAGPGGARRLCRSLRRSATCVSSSQLLLGTSTSKGGILQQRIFASQDELYDERERSTERETALLMKVGRFERHVDVGEKKLLSAAQRLDCALGALPDSVKDAGARPFKFCSTTTVDIPLQSK